MLYLLKYFKGGINILTTSNVYLSYGNMNILEDVTIAVNLGESTAILGRNGSGKSTFLRALSGAHKVKSGEISLDGISVAEKSAQIKIGYVPQNDIVFDDLSVIDNLKFWGAAYGIKNKDAIKNNAVVEILRIDEFMNKKVKHLSGGMKKRLCIAASILHDPLILILDEPFSGVDIVAKQELINYLQGFQSGGKTLIITSHNAAELVALCEKFYYIKNKKIEKAPNADEIKSGINLEESIAGLIGEKNCD